MENNTFISHKHRGMLLETIINNTISYYLRSKIAFISKQNLNISLQNVIKTKNNALKISNSYIKSKSTVDYYGIYKGQYICFEAKSTEEESLPLTNIKKHQHDHLKLIKQLGGKAFYIVLFKKQSRVFLIDVNDLDYENTKSFSIEEAEWKGKELTIIFPGIIDFLAVI